MSTPASTTVDPRPVWSLINGFTTYWTVVAAIRLGIFDALASGPRESGDLTRGCDARGAGALLDALVGLGLLARDSGTYALTPVSDAFLVTDRPASMRDLVVWSPGPSENWPALDETVLRGTPASPIDDDAAGTFYRHLVRATFPTQHAVAKGVAPRLGEPRRILDLGAGGAPWAVALLEAFPSATATVNDLDAVVPDARARLQANGVAARAEVRPGDYLSVMIEPASYDVVVLGHLLRAEGDERAQALLARAAGALRAGGHLVLTDYFLADDRDGPLNALLLGVAMVASTRAGRARTESTVRSWLAAAGLPVIDAFEPVPSQRVLLARASPAPDERGT